MVFSFSLCSCKTDTRTNAEQYLDDIEKCRSNSDFHSQLYIFPEALNGETEKYFYMETSSLFTGDYFFYLVLKYNEDVYKSEIERLKNVHAYFPKFDKTKEIIHFENNSLFLTIMKDNRYEYSIYDNSTNTIAYISNQLYTWEEAKVLPEHKLPDLKIPGEFDDGNNSYNIYYNYVDDVGWEITD